MSNFWKQKVARESVENAADDNLSNIETPEENLESNLEELASEDAALDGLMSDGATLNEDMAKTEDAVEAADEALDQGEELSEFEAETKEIGQESIRRRWGIQRTRVARESFRGGRGATKIARESWQDTLKDLWKRFIELVETILAKAKDQWLKITNVGKSASKRGKKYKEVIAKLGSKAKKDNIGGSWMSKLAIDNKFDAENSVGIAVTMLGGAAGASTIQSLIDNAITVVGKTTDGKTEFTQQGSDELKLPAKAAKNIKSLPGMEDGQAYAVIALPGNAYFQQGEREIGGHKFASMQYINAGDKVEEKEVSTPSTADLRKYADQLEKMGNSYEKVLKDFRKIDEKMKKLKDEAKKAVAAFDKSEDENRDALRGARQAANAAVSCGQVYNKMFNSTVRVVISGLSGYIGAGIGAYEKAKN